MAERATQDGLGLKASPGDLVTLDVLRRRYGITPDGEMALRLDRIEEMLARLLDHFGVAASSVTREPVAGEEDALAQSRNLFGGPY